jgi:hypothetical protein
MASFSRMVSDEARAPSKSRFVRERARCWAKVFDSPSLLFVPEANTGLNPDGKEDGGGTGERGC